MELYIWLLYFLPMSRTLKILPEVHLDGELGGSIIIQCPLPEINVRMYLCRQTASSRMCTTVVSNGFVKKGYKNRVTLKPLINDNIFLVEVKDLTNNDSGVYACGLGINTDRGLTQKVTVNVHNEFNPFWEDEPISEPPGWFHRFLHQEMPSWFHGVTHATSTEFIPKVSTPGSKSEYSPVQQPSSATPTTHSPPVSGTFLVAAAEPPDFLPTTTVSKTLAQEGVRPIGTSYSYHTRLHKQRILNHGPQFGREDQEFHILIPSVLGLLLIVLLGLVIKRAIQRRKAYSRRLDRLAVRMRARGSRRSRAQRPGLPQRLRSQSNVYSACPRRARDPDDTRQEEPPVPSAQASAPSAPLQILEASWTYAPSLKTGCELVTLCHQPAANVEDTDSDDYINVPGPTHLPSCPSSPRPLCQ